MTSPECNDCGIKMKRRKGTDIFECPMCGEQCEYDGGTFWSFPYDIIFSKEEPDDYDTD